MILLSCNGIKSIKSAFIKKSPYEHYVQRLENAQLDKTVLASSWIDAGKRALQDSITISLPFTEGGSFQAGIPEARSYSFAARDGQVLQVSAKIKSAQSAAMFVDLFARTDTTWTALAHGDSTLQLSYEFEKDQQCLIRIQPELLVNTYYTITITMTPVLVNPVQGASNKSIGSFYGDARDGGKRKHESVDIFAPKGTPVVAPTAGRITRVGTSTLGGKVVWMQDGKRGNSYYFAHLDEQLVKPGVNVKQGDTLGLVGNTGNAKYTPSHLHFGIYQTKSKDPIHYILTMDKLDNPSPLDTAFNFQPYRVIQKNALLRVGPDVKQGVREKLSKDTYVRVLAQTKTWYRVALPDNRQGFLPKSIGSTDKGRLIRLKSDATLLSESKDDAAPLEHLQKSSTVEILARFKNFDFVKTKAGQTGWIMAL
ncbi:M23 family metallopeptidase [Pseudochryseolinea flava]|nr:M23 family metallopeptidase [Pseudochryseolinea flava]